MEVWKAVLSALAENAGHGRAVSEHRFHSSRMWRFDLAWPRLKVAFEKEGMAPGAKSRHTTLAGYAGDCEKYNEAQLLGWLVIRATAKQIESGQASTWLLAALKLRSQL